MARIAAILLAVVCAHALAAHPFDDRCDMIAQLLLERDAKRGEAMVLLVQYRYESPYASYNEAYLSLDDNRDEKITRAELDARYKTLSSDLISSVHLSVRDELATLEPDYTNFAFLNLDDPDATVDQAGGMGVLNLRIGYFFTFLVKLPAEPGPGKHPVQFWMANRRVAITDAADQLQAWDDRGPERRAVTSVRHDKTADRYDRLTFLWEIDGEAVVIPEDPPIVPQPEDPPVEPAPANTETAPRKSPREQLIETDQQRHDPEAIDNRISQAMAQLRDGGADPWVWLLVLGMMFGYGAWHALMPGHGKALVGGYLIGTRGTKADALFLGVVVTAAHTSGVYLLLGGAWAARKMWPGVLENPEKELAEWIALAVGATIFLMGIGLVFKRAGARGGHQHDIFGRHVHDQDHGHSHDHGHPEDSDILHEVGHSHDHAGHSHGGHAHEHRDPLRMTRWEILRLGILGGIIPCPSAFIIGLLAFRWQMEVSGLIAVLAFSVGLATVLAVIGLMLVQSKAYMDSRPRKGPITRFAEQYLPVFGALLITVIGVLITVFALIRLNFIDPVKFTV